MDSITKAREGKITQDEFVKTNVAKAIGAVFLIIPGFFTDMLGIALQFGFLTMLVTKIFDFKKPEQTSQYTNNFEYHHTSFNNTTYTNERKGSNDEIIDVEIIDDSKSIKH